MTFITTDEQLGRVVRNEVKAALVEKEGKPNPEKLYSISDTAELLGKSYNTICRMITQKRLISTTDGKYISQRAIDSYLGGAK